MKKAKVFILIAVFLAVATFAGAAERVINGKRITESDEHHVTGDQSVGGDQTVTGNGAFGGSVSIRGALSTEIYEIGTPGELGFGVGAYYGTLPAGFTALSGHDDIRSPNYGNYQYADGSIMCWIPKFYYRVYTGTIYPKDQIEIRGTSYFANTTAANTAGYALHRMFIDGGAEKAGVFVDKYENSKAAWGTGYIASSIANGNPLSTASDHNPIGDLTATSGANYYYSAITAAHARDGVNGAVNANSKFFCSSRFIYGGLAMLAHAHAQASAAATTKNAWYNSTSNFPKGNNNNALADTNDTTVVYTTDGYSNCGQTGSGAPLAKTTHNGQASGVADLNGNLYEISIGITCIATTAAIEGLSQANPCVVTWTAHGLATGDYVQIGTTAITQANWTVLNDKIYKITYIGADSFSLDGVDSSGFSGAYVPATDPGTIRKGVFYTAKQATPMKTFTSGTAGATDHWGVTGVAAMMDVFVPTFETAYPNNGTAQKMGDSIGQVLSALTSGANGYLKTGLGFPSAATGVSPTGTAAFGTDYYYQCITNELCLLSGMPWNNGSNAGVWASHWNNSRGYSGNYVGLRLACYPD